MMVSLNKLKPAFWDQSVKTGDTDQHPGLNFQRKWKLIVLFTTFIALLPLFVMTFVDYNITCSSIKNQTYNQMATSVAAASNLIQTDLKEKKWSLDKVVSILPMLAEDDLFIINTKGTLLTDSKYFGPKGTMDRLDTAAMKKSHGINEIEFDHNQRLLASYRKIQGC